MREQINEKPLSVSLRYVGDEITMMLTLKHHVELKLGKPVAMTEVINYVIHDYVERNIPA